MSNRPENVPIATLAGLAPLTDVLRKLPLPRLKEDKNNQNLVRPEFASKAKAMLQSPELKPDVVHRVASQLSQVNTAYLEFKNPSHGESLKWHQKTDKLPPVLVELMKKNPQIFNPVELYDARYPVPGNASSGKLSTPVLSPQKLNVPHGIPSAPKLQQELKKSLNTLQSPTIFHHGSLQTHGSPTKSQETTIERHPIPMQDHKPDLNLTGVADVLKPTSLEKPKHKGGHQNFVGIKVFHTRQSSKNKKPELSPPPLRPSSKKTPNSEMTRTQTPTTVQVHKNSPDSFQTKVQYSEVNDDLIKDHLQDEQPPIPKLVLKRTTKRLGSKEYETHEIVSPVAKESGISAVPLSSPKVESTLSTVVSQVKESVVSKQVKRKASDVERTSVTSEDSLKDLKNKRQKSDDDEEDDYFGEEFEVGEGKRFTKALKKLLEYEQNLEDDGQLDLAEDAEIPEDSLLPRPIITDLCLELSKIKQLAHWKDFPADKIVSVIATMDRHVRQGMQLLLNQAQEDVEEEEKLWRSLTIEKHLRSAEAAVTILHFTTSPKMPKQVFLEEAIDHVVTFCKFQLENTIYPDVDPVYRVDPDNKSESCLLPKTRRSRGTASSKSKSMLQLYNKLCEMVGLLGDLVSKETLTDTIILQVSALGTMPFFVENVSVLQLEALKLVRNIFRKYTKHRDLILDDILASLAKLPSSKRNLRSYRLHDDLSVQMMSALVLQLIQCTVKLPEEELKDDSRDPDVLMVTSYEDAIRAAQNFLSAFLKKCGSASRDESDFRPLFENFLQDLLIMLNKPEWPAAEIVLTRLGKLLIVTFNSKNNEMALRVASIDYLALIATHLRKDAVQSIENEQDEIYDILKKIIGETTEQLPENELTTEEAHMKHLQKALLNFLAVGSQNDDSLKYAREFFLAQWLTDVHVELEKCVRAPMMSIPGAASNDIPTDGADTSIENIQYLEGNKKYYHDLAVSRAFNLRHSQQNLTAYEARVVARHLASSRAFSQSFDIYLQQIFKVLNEQVIAFRAKAMKCLTQIVSVDPSILAREDVQASVHARFLDQSTNVREAAVDLIGQFVLKCPDLMDRYYDMISERILDTGISVRKRVIKILKDICIEQPEYPKIPEIYVKLIRRINDEEGIRELVTKVFQKMWFSPVSSSEPELLLQRAHNITKVVSLSKENGHEWFENLLESIFDVDDDASKKVILKACQQLVDCLVEKLLKSEEQSNSGTTVPCLTTLLLIGKVQPQFLIKHAPTLQPYLSIKCNSQADIVTLQNVAKILEMVVPLMEHPNPKFLADLEEDLMKLILKQGQNVVQSCISCFASIVNNVTHNYKFVMECFQKFYGFLSKAKQLFHTLKASQLASCRLTLLRSIFSVGLLCKHFDIDALLPRDNKQETISEEVFSICLHFAQYQDEEISLKAILAGGFVGVRCPDLLLRQDTKVLYKEALSPELSTSKRSCTILQSLRYHLMEEETRNRRSETSGKTQRKKKKKEEERNLQEFGDAHSGSTSAVMQVLLKDILETFLHPEHAVRLKALQVISLILRQGLIHPAQCVPYLVCISTEDDVMARTSAEQCLTDIDSRHGGFIHMKALQGVKLSHKFQRVVQGVEDGYLRGYRQLENRQAMIGHVYMLLRGSKQYRRPFLMSLLKLVDDPSAPKDLVIYIVENLAYLPYVTQEEPLYVINQVDTIASVTGANLLQSFREVMSSVPKEKETGGVSSMFDDEEEEDVDQLTDWDIDVKKLEQTVQSSFACLLLLELKQHLKQLFGFADSKCQKYSPSEPTKLYDKNLNRKGDSDFHPQCFSVMFKESDFTKDEMLSFYVMFKQFMLTLDSEEESDTEVTLETSLDVSKSVEKSVTDLGTSGVILPIPSLETPVINSVPTTTSIEVPVIANTGSSHDTNEQAVTVDDQNSRDCVTEDESVGRKPKRKRSKKSSSYGSD